MTTDSSVLRIALTEAYQHSEYDPLQATNLLQDEITQRRESGYDVDAVVDRANATDPTDRAAVLALVALHT